MKNINTIDIKATSLEDLVNIYCPRCTVGLYNCTISACDCQKIATDRDFKEATRPKNNNK